MKKSKLFIGIGAFALAIAGVFASKANKKFASFSTCYASFTAGALSGYAYLNGTNLFTTVNNTHPLQLKVSTTAVTLENVQFQTVGQGRVAYYK